MLNSYKQIMNWCTSISLPPNPIQMHMRIPMKPTGGTEVIATAVPLIATSVPGIATG
jgi:hypothetical protein